MRNSYVSEFFMMDKHVWRLFLDAVEFGSLTKVALAHSTSQPHVSRQISELEAKCGSPLLMRNGRGVVLTEFGRRIEPQIRSWLGMTEQLQNDILSFAKEPIGQVRLGILPSLAHPFVSTLFERMQLRYPLVKLQIREGQGAQLETWLEDGRLDLALLLRHGQGDARSTLAISETQTYVVGMSGDVLTRRSEIPFQALDHLPLVTFCRPSSWRDRLEEIARKQGVNLNVILEADSLALQLAIVRSNQAYALLGFYAIQEALENGLIQAARLSEPHLPRHVAMEFPKTGQISPAIRAVVNNARELANELAGIK